MKYLKSLQSSNIERAVIGCSDQAVAEQGDHGHWCWVKDVSVVRRFEISDKDPPLHLQGGRGQPHPPPNLDLTFIWAGEAPPQERDELISVRSTGEMEKDFKVNILDELD